MTEARRVDWAARALVLSLIVAACTPALAASQSPADIGAEAMGHFDASMGKVFALAEAMPEDLYGWSPGEGVMPVARVYAHITRYNFMYLADNMGVPAPDGLDVDGIESITDKSAILELMSQSMVHVKQAMDTMSAHELGSPTVLYGRDVAKWAVLVQLVAHMNEHLGQSIAYARMNGVVPPWSR